MHVAHSHVVAHQNFAVRLLSWLQGFLDRSAVFRALFAATALQAPLTPSSTSSSTSSGAARSRGSAHGGSAVELFCRSDTVLWKLARSQMHRLLISGMLKENDSKRRFACEFAKSYGHMMKDFMQDDHDHSFSITSLSVQLFTVPSLSHHLVAEEDVMAILLM